MESAKEVVVVGGGLVGSLAAFFIAKRGYHVRVYESKGDIRLQNEAKGRSINLAVSNRALKSLRQVGLEKMILEKGVPMKGRLIHRVDGSQQSILYDKCNKQCIYSVSRNLLNQSLLTAIASHPNIELHFNTKLVDADLEKGRISFLQSKNHVAITVECDCIIGADGAYSTVRRMMQDIPCFNLNETNIDHGYVELNINPINGKKMVANHLHIWPRGSFMMIALPNLDGSWTATLFMPFQRFERIQTASDLVHFFKMTFNDAMELISEDELISCFFKRKPSHLFTVECSRFHHGKALLIGDAAHAMVPFYGQGMNCGFEDCLILDSLFAKFGPQIPFILEMFTSTRLEDAHAICKLAACNYVEMRDLVTRPSYQIRKRFDDFLYGIMPTIWVPLYNSVTFTDMNYRNCVENKNWQDRVIYTAFAVLTFLIPLIFLYVHLTTN